MYKDKERFMKKNKPIKVLEMLKEHVNNNKKEYLLITLLFIIGIFLGVLFVNNIQETQKSEMTTYLNNYIGKMKDIETLNHAELLKSSIGQNIVLAITLWFFGTTVIGIPVVFGMIIYRGFCLGYTIAVCIMALGLPQGILFVFILLLWHLWTFV